MYNTSFIKKILLVATVVLLYSCDKDFNAIGGDLIGDNHFGLESEKYDVLAYNQEITPIQSNGLAINGLGIYDNPVLGSTTGNFTSQVALAAYAPTIGEEPVIDSVYIRIPYFSHIKTANADGTTTYELDSIFGSPGGRIKLGIYESGIQMRTSVVDNGQEFAQMYYTDQDSDSNTDGINFNAKKIGNRLNDSEKVAQNDEFFFSSKELTDKTVDATTGKESTTKLSPRMHLRLNNDFFQAKILNAASSKLAAADVFQEYFRGLYFKAEKSPTTTESNMALLDFSKGTITIAYKAKTAITTDAETVKEAKTIVINLSGAKASLLQDAKKSEYANAILPVNINTTDGDESLYLKGGQGSLAVINLTGFASKLEQIRASKWLVNEANLVFHIDAAKMAPVADEPKRIYLYDLTNNIPLIDYSDGTTGFIDGDPLKIKYVFGGLIELDSNKRGTTYKIRITNHIRNLIKDATAVNVKLGLVVTQDISVITSNKLKAKNNVISEAPRASVMSPLGTVLYGGKSTIPDDKRLKLEIYYTKPN